MIDILIVFALLGAIAALVLHVLPRQGGGRDRAAPQSLFPD